MSSPPKLNVAGFPTTSMKGSYQIYGVRNKPAGQNRARQMSEDDDDDRPTKMVKNIHGVDEDNDRASFIDPDDDEEETNETGVTDDEDSDESTSDSVEICRCDLRRIKRLSRATTTEETGETGDLNDEDSDISMEDYETNDVEASQSTCTLIPPVKTPENNVLISYKAQLDIRSIVRQRKIIRDALTENGTVKPSHKEEHDAAMKLYNRMVKKVVTAVKKGLGGAGDQDEAQSLVGWVFNIEKSQLQRNRSLVMLG
jgi:hypothetical protein